MLRKFLLPTLILSAFMVFIGFVYFNYSVAQQAIKETKPSPLFVEIISFPEKIKVNHSGHFSWRVEGSPDLSTSFTTIFWGYQATPSALTRSDSPAAVAYPYSQPDYTTGSFKLPDSFDLNIFFNRPGTVWFRAYSNIRGEHLWSEEKQIMIEK